MQNKEIDTKSTQNLDSLWRNQLSSLDGKYITNLNAFKHENGENPMHNIARYWQKSFKEHAFTKGGLKLLDIPDNDGRYPLEYFFCFADKYELKSSIKEVIDASEKHKLRKPNWLEVKMLIVENHATYSGVDSVPMNMWQQQTPEEFKACLKTERGQKFIKMATNYDYHYSPCFYDDFHGMNINMYVNSNDRKDGFSFFYMTDTKDEIELSLVQLVLFIAKCGKQGGVVGASIKKQFDFLIEKAVLNNIDMKVLKEKMLAAFPEFERFSPKNFNGLKYIDIIVERKRLSLVVNKDNIKSNNKMLQQNSL